jgi:hypothetical protein
VRSLIAVLAVLAVLAVSAACSADRAPVPDASPENCGESCDASAELCGEMPVYCDFIGPDCPLLDEVCGDECSASASCCTCEVDEWVVVIYDCFCPDPQTDAGVDGG